MRPVLRSVLTNAGYPVFYLVAMAGFFHVTFPDERLKERIESEFNERQPMGEGVRLEVGHASPHWFNGIELEGVRLIDTTAEAEAAEAAEEQRKAASSTKPKHGAEKQSAPGASASAGQVPSAVPAAAQPSGVPGTPPGNSEGMVVDELTVSVSVLRALLGTVAVVFEAEAFGGSFQGSFAKSDELQTITAELDHVGVGGLPLFRDLVGLPMGGTVSGAIDLVTPEQKLAKAEGTMKLVIDDLKVGDGKAKILKTIALPLVNVGRLELEAEVVAGVLRIVKLNAAGKDLDVEADGRIRLRDPVDRSMLELNLRFRFADSYKNRNDMTRALFGGDGVPGLLELDSKVKRSKREDGFYAWRASGLMSRPSFLPESGSRGATRRTGKVTPR